jgi:hypothetical protein
MIFNFKVVIVRHHIRGKAVIVALAALVCLRFAWLCARVAFSAGYWFWPPGTFSVAFTAVTAVNLLELSMFVFTGLHIIAVALLTTCRLGSRVEVMMTLGTGFSGTAMLSMVKEYRACCVSEIAAVCCRHIFFGHTANNGRYDCDKHGDCQRSCPVFTIMNITTHDYPLK